MKIEDSDVDYSLSASVMVAGKVYKERRGKIYMCIRGVVDEDGDEISMAVEGIDLANGEYAVFENQHRFKECHKAVLNI